MANSKQNNEPELTLITPAVAAQPSAVSSPAPTPAKAAPNWRMLSVVALLGLTALAFGGRMWWRSHYFVETENAYVSGHVHPVSSRIGGTIVRVVVEDNQQVAPGDVLAELDPVDQKLKIEQIQAQIASAEQQVLQADAQVAQARAQASATLAQVAQAKAQVQRTSADAQRFGQLYTSDMKAVSKAEVDTANANLAAANADLAARLDLVQAAQAQISTLGAARDVIKAQIRVLQVQLKDAQQQLAYNRILAPVAGRVGKRSMEVGARVQPGQQLAAIVQENAWITANFKETQLAGLRAGQSASVTIDALPGHHFEGRIDSFSPASGAQFALLPADNATGNFTKIVQRMPVKIVLRPEDLRQIGARLAPGMSATVEIKLEQAAGKVADLGDRGDRKLARAQANDLH